MWLQIDFEVIQVLMDALTQVGWHLCKLILQIFKKKEQQQNGGMGVVRQRN